MEKNVVNWFEVPVEDMDRAKNFYSKLLGITLSDMPSPEMEMAVFPMVQGAENSAGALVKSSYHEPATVGTTIYFSCEDVANQLGKVPDLGGQIVMPKTSIGEYGFIAHIIDTEGNKVALHSQK